MKVLTIGDSWTYGEESTNPATHSWPAQMAERYGASVVNLARSGASNKRAMRICYEELARDSSYDWVVLPLAPASRTEIMKTGKWYQIWPNKRHSQGIDRLFTEFYHSWNDVQQTILDCYGFINAVANIGPQLYITGLSMGPSQYQQEISWVERYTGDWDFASLGMPLSELNIGPADLDRKLKCLQAMHQANLKLQPDYFLDTIEHIDLHAGLRNPGGHPTDSGYSRLADHFAEKIGLVKR